MLYKATDPPATQPLNIHATPSLAPVVAADWADLIESFRVAITRGWHDPALGPIIDTFIESVRFHGADLSGVPIADSQALYDATTGHQTAIAVNRWLATLDKLNAVLDAAVKP